MRLGIYLVAGRERAFLLERLGKAHIARLFGQSDSGAGEFALGLVLGYEVYVASGQALKGVEARFVIGLPR